MSLWFKLGWFRLCRVRLLEQLHEATDDSERTHLIVHAFETLEERYPQLSDVATQSQLRETELRLQKEIKQIDANLRTEMKQIDAKIVLMESKIVQVEANLRTEIKQIEVNLQTSIVAQTRWILGGLAALGTLFKLLSIF